MPSKRPKRMIRLSSFGTFHGEEKPALGNRLILKQGVNAPESTPTDTRFSWFPFAALSRRRSGVQIPYALPNLGTKKTLGNPRGLFFCHIANNVFGAKSGRIPPAPTPAMWRIESTVLGCSFWQTKR